MIKHTYFNPSKIWDELSFIKLKLGRVGMGRVLHLRPSWHGPIFMWAELVLGRVVLHPNAGGWGELQVTCLVIYFEHEPGPSGWRT